MMPSIMSGSLMRETPPWARMSAGTRSSAMTATAPASSAILACSGVTTSMITPPLSMSAMPRLTRDVPVVCGVGSLIGASREVLQRARVPCRAATEGVMVPKTGGPLLRGGAWTVYEPVLRAPHAPS